MGSLPFLEKIENLSSTKNPHPVSGHTLQFIIGILAFLFPTILIVGSAILGNCEEVHTSISAYYHTVMRDFFVGALCAIALGLLAYYGYSSLDNIMANVAAVFTLGVAFFPTCVRKTDVNCLDYTEVNRIIGSLHFISAALLFLTLAFFCLILFTKTGEVITKRKKLRNKIYKICGYTILLCIAIIAIYLILLDSRFEPVDHLKPVFVFEAIALYAFSISWFVKADIILKDKEE